MSGDSIDVLIRIRRRPDEAAPFPVEVEVSDGARYPPASFIAPEPTVADGESESYGKALFDALLPDPVRQALDHALSAGKGSCRVRLLIDPDAVGLESIRWERLYRRRDDHWLPISTGEDTPFSLYRMRPNPDPLPIATLPVRILLAVASPSLLPRGLRPIQVREEVDTFYEALRAAAALDTADVTVLARRADLGPELCAKLEGNEFEIVDGRTTITEFVRHLSGRHIVHFVGHGGYPSASTAPGGAALFFESEAPSAEDSGADEQWDVVDPVTGDELVRRFANLSPAPGLVYLSACRSAEGGETGGTAFVGIAPRLIDGGVSAVVAMQDLVPVSVARSVAADFYRNLFETGLVDLAINRGRSTVYDDSGPDDWTIPTLITRLHAGRLLVSRDFANRVIADDIALQPEPEHGVIADRVDTRATPRRRASPVRLLPRDFPDLLGRSHLIEQGLADIQASTPVEFTGPPGAGKTVILRRLANQAAATGSSVVHVPYGDEPLDDVLMFLFDALYEADASLRPSPASLLGFLREEDPVIVVDDADVPRDVVQKLIELVPNGRFVLASVEENLVGEGHPVPLEGLSPADGLALFGKTLGRPFRDEEASRAAGLCTAVAGMPLAIIEAARLVARGIWPDHADASTTSRPDAAVAIQAAAIDAMGETERAVLAVIAAAAAPVRWQRVEAVTRDPDAEATCESLRKAGLVRAASPRYALAKPLPPGYEDRLEVAGWRKALAAHLVDLVARNRRSPGSLLRDLDVIVAAISAPDVDAASAAALAKGAEAALILSKRWGQWARVLDREVEIATAAGDQPTIAWARHAQGSRALALREHDLARQHLSSALEIRKRLKDDKGVAVTEHNLRLLGPLPSPWDILRRHRGRLLGGLAALGALAFVLGYALGIGRPTPPSVPGNHLPIARLQPEGLDFGGQVVGSSISGTVVLSNDGKADLEIFESTFDPLVAGVSLAQQCRQTIPAGTDCNIVVRFEPETVGDFVTTLRLRDNTAEGTQVLTIKGAGVPPAGRPALAIDPPALDFKIVVPGATETLPVSLSSEGTGAVQIASVRVDGPGFSLVGDECSNRSFEPGSGCRLTIAFSPTTAGDARGHVTISDSTAMGIHTVELAGSGLRGLPDLQVAMDIMGSPIFRDDETIGVPIIVIIRNDGDTDAAVFSTRVLWADPHTPESVSLAPLLLDDGYGLESDGLGGAQTTGPIPPGGDLKFTGSLILPRDLANRTLDFVAEVDSCFGDLVRELAPPSSCRVEESDETNNLSNKLELSMPYIVQ